MGVVQIDENAAGALLKGRGVEMDVLSHRRAMGDLGSGPKTIPRKDFSGVVVNQPEEINWGHRCQLAPNCLQCEKDSAIHARNLTRQNRTFYFALTRPAKKPTEAGDSAAKGPRDSRCYPAGCRRAHWPSGWPQCAASPPGTRRN